MTIESANDNTKISSNYCQNIVKILSLYRHFIVNAIVKISPKYHPLTIILAQVTIESANDNIETRDPFWSCFSRIISDSRTNDEKIGKRQETGIEFIMCITASH